MVASQDRQLGYALDSEFYNTESFVDYVRGKLEKLTFFIFNAKEVLAKNKARNKARNKEKRTPNIFFNITKTFKMGKMPLIF